MGDKKNNVNRREGIKETCEKRGRGGGFATRKEGDSMRQRDRTRKRTMQRMLGLISDKEKLLPTFTWDQTQRQYLGI